MMSRPCGKCGKTDTEYGVQVWLHTRAYDGHTLCADCWAEVEPTIVRLLNLGPLRPERALRQDLA